MAGVSSVLSTAATHATRVGDPLAYYTTTATIIPVIFLALVYQTRYLRDTGGAYDTISVAQLWLAAGAMAVAAVGEAQAMHVLVTQHPTTDARRLTGVALIILGTAVVSEPALSVLSRWRDSAHESVRRDMSVVVYGWLATVWGIALIVALATLGIIY